MPGHPVPLIVGIDPGTTTALAVLDTSGRLLLLKSGRGLDRSRISRLVTELGVPVIVACDRRPAPSFVERAASTFSARLVVPEENLRVREKERLSREFMQEHPPRTNKHERDALAAALFAYNSIKPTMRRVEQRLKALGFSGDGELDSFVRTRVILHRDHVKRAISKFQAKGKG